MPLPCPSPSPTGLLRWEPVPRPQLISLQLRSLDLLSSSYMFAETLESSLLTFVPLCCRPMVASEPHRSYDEVGSPHSSTPNSWEIRKVSGRVGIFFFCPTSIRSNGQFFRPIRDRVSWPRNQKSNLVRSFMSWLFNCLIKKNFWMRPIDCDCVCPISSDTH